YTGPRLHRNYGHELPQPGRHRGQLVRGRVQPGVDRRARGDRLAVLGHDLVGEAEARALALAHPAADLEQVVEARRTDVAHDRLDHGEVDLLVHVGYREPLL